MVEREKDLYITYVSDYHMINENILKFGHREGFDQEEICEAYKLFFGTLVSEPRLKIINLLRKGKMNVTQIMDRLKMDQPLVSHNLSRLKLCGFVNAERNGKFVVYGLNKDTIKPLMETIDEHMSKYCIHILRKIKEDGR